MNLRFFDICITREGPISGFLIVLANVDCKTEHKTDFNLSASTFSKFRSKVSGLVTPFLVDVLPASNKVKKIETKRNKRLCENINVERTNLHLQFKHQEFSEQAVFLSLWGSLEIAQLPPHSRHLLPSLQCLQDCSLELCFLKPHPWQR